MAFSWSRSADGPNGVSYSTDTGKPASAAPVATASGATIAGGEIVDTLTALGQVVINNLAGSGLPPTLAGNASLTAINGAANQGGIVVAKASPDLGGPSLVMYKTRGATADVHATVNTGDFAGKLRFYVDDGTNAFETANIRALVNGTVTTGSVPTDLVFTTGSVSGGGTEAMRIKSDQTVQMSGPVNLGTFARVTGSDFTTTNTTATDIAGLTAACVANATYAFRAVLSVNGADANGLKVAVQFSAAGAAVEAIASGSLAAATAQAVRVSALNTLTAAFATSATDGGIVIEGILPVGANPGNLTIQVAKVTSGTARVRINSFLDVKRIA